VSDPYVDFPLVVDGTGRLGRTAVDDHVRDMIEQVLLTSPGERVNRPDFGCGLLELVFEPASELLVAATELRTRAALQRWLGDVVDVRTLNVRLVDTALIVELEYLRMLDGTTGTMSVELPRSGP
jgi:phage baseplate assembly protein W